MTFTSQIFVFYFLPLFLSAYYLLPGRRNLLLLGASYVFCAWCQPWSAVWLLVATVVNYACGRIISESPIGSRRRPVALGISVAASLSMLALFKYWGFLQDNANQLLELMGKEAWRVFRVALPAGISFYVFQNVTYTVDLYRGQCRPARSLGEFACFIAMFPKLLMGPITRFDTVAGQFLHRACTLQQMASGAALFILGFAKKTLLANMIGRAADTVFAAAAPGMLDAWFGATAYAFQIYFDFSGYSDMAVGLGRLLGFELPRNFNAPYLARSVTDFWRRWHISLSSFLRDYLYIPLGGNRKGPLRTGLNLAIVMLLGGLWHGANWTFVAWGGYHGAWLILERWRGKQSLYARLPAAMQVSVTFVLLVFSWVLFRSASLSDAWRMLGTLLGLSGGLVSSPLLGAVIYTQGNPMLMGLCALLAFQPQQAWDWVNELTWPKVALAVPLFGLSLMAMFAQAFNPFLYSQF